MVTTEAALKHSKYGADDPVYRLGEFTSYREAEHMVSRLSDVGFPVVRVRIVGAGMQNVEQPTGRLAKVRATLIGAGLGAWLGLVTGLVTGLLLALSGAGLVWLTAMLGGPLIGAAFGAALGFITHWATDGRRDSASTTDLRRGGRLSRSTAPTQQRTFKRSTGPDSPAGGATIRFAANSVTCGDGPGKTGVQVRR
jgi:hypothetical protein